jgi:hypothetical protein
MAPQPWFEGRIDRAALGLDSSLDLEEDSAACGATGGTGLLDALAGARGGAGGVGSAAAALDGLMDEARAALSSDSARLLKKADEIIAKQKKM